MRLYLPWKTFSGKAGFLFGRDFSFLRRKFQFCPKEIIFSFEQNNGYLLKEKQDIRQTIIRYWQGRNTAIKQK